MSDEHGKAVAIIERSSEHAGMSPIVAASLEILRQDPSPETLRELLQVQKEYEANEARKAYALALVNLKRDLPRVIAHDKVVDFTGSTNKRTRYTHTSLAAVMEAVTEPLVQHGFSLTWNPSTAQGQVSVTCRLAHMAGHFEETTISAPVDKSGSKSDAQGVMSTITLLRRYTALALLGIATADMSEPEGEAKAQNPENIDSNRNLKAVGWLKKHGRTVEQAEEFVGRKVPDWTRADLEKLEAWAKPEPTPKT